MPFSKKARGDEFFASPGGTGEPATSDDPGALDANIVAALCHLAKSKQLDGHPVLSPPSLWRDLGYRHAPP
jgi:hypothetical protein